MTFWQQAFWAACLWWGREGSRIVAEFWTGLLGMVRLILTFVLWLFPVTVYAVWEGDQAPLFSLPSLEDKTTTVQNRIQLEQFRGQVVLVDFWASWCLPCRRSFPVLDALYQKFHDKGFVIIGLDEDRNRSAGKKFIQQWPVTFPLAWDAGGTVARAYRLRGMPSSYLIDKKGIVRYAWIGFPGGDHTKELEKKIQKLLVME